MRIDYIFPLLLVLSKTGQQSASDCPSKSCNLRNRNTTAPVPSFQVLNSTSADGEVKKLNWRTIEHRDGQVILKSYLTFDPGAASQASPRPAVLLLHDWDGRDEFENGKAEAIARMGYVAYAVDLFGRVGGTPWKNDQLVKPFRRNRALLLKRLQLAVDEVATLPFVDAERLAAIGFSFGALGALDMARAGWDLRGVVSFHGTLTGPSSLQHEQMAIETANITAKILVLHGYLDRSDPPASVREFQQAMTKRKADWQVYLYANATGEFTKPSANVPGRSMYNAAVDQRSWTAMKNFLLEIFL